MGGRTAGSHDPEDASNPWLVLIRQAGTINAAMSLNNSDSQSRAQEANTRHHLMRSFFCLYLDCQMARVLTVRVGPTDFDPFSSS